MIEFDFLATYGHTTQKDQDKYQTVRTTFFLRFPFINKVFQMCKEMHVLSFFIAKIDLIYAIFIPASTVSLFEHILDTLLYQEMQKYPSDMRVSEKCIDPKS